MSSFDGSGRNVEPLREAFGVWRSAFALVLVLVLVLESARRGVMEYCAKSGLHPRSR
jgi:hypothetical protein